MVIGMNLTGRSDVTVENINVKGFEYGIYLYLYSSNNSISGNNITDNGDGIYAQTCYNDNSIYGNNIARALHVLWLQN